jgi:5-methylcytosine-specific restriction endonuclease McrA
VSGYTTIRAKQIGKVTIKQLMQKVESQGFKCAYTGIDVTPRRSSLDHKEPRSLGGDDDINNLQVVLPTIQRAKTNMSHRQFIAMCHAVARHVQDSGDTTWIDGLID